MAVRQKIVIAGCGGFVGSHLLDRLLEYPDIAVEGWDRSSHRIRDHLGDPRLTFHCASVTEASTHAALKRAVRGADAVVNLAAACNPSEYNRRPLQTIRANFSDLCPLVELCADEHIWLIHFSTSEVYGRTLASYVTPGTYDNPGLYELDEDTSPLVMGPIRSQRWTYASAKQLLERLILALHTEAGLPYTIVRPLNVFGPRMDYVPGHDGLGLPRILASFMGALLDGTPLQVVDGGTARRTILSIYDAVEAVMLMLARRQAAENQIFNIGSRANEVSVLELAHLMRCIYARITGNSQYNDHPIALVEARALYGEGYEDCDRRMPRIAKARLLLGWEPRATLEDVLVDAMTYYHEHYRRDDVARLVRTRVPT